ncbi:hypothetical protein DEO72_LG11g3298 [Vigna unguiculata]|uniref:Wall-associated receptor kinase galacturonan-binding domain-containing protein n=1 Tax=Vigna unguiculata TaxID=3917 RepID=A0A4D6NVH7_VIGUN|nr:hypothetical protein DEO72_LG11g3298 [Vigna unguiculata]
MMNPNTQFFILKPLYFRITNSYIIIFYLLAQITSSQVDPKFTACAPKTCPNNNQSISFPFYIQGTQQPYCGSPGFEISCAADGSPTLNLSHTQYLIRFGEKAKKTLKRIPGSVSASSETDSRIRCSENKIKKRKRIMYSILAFCEMDFTIRFDKKKLKRNVCSVSTFCETDFTIRFSKKNKTKRRRAKDGACGVARKKGKRRKGVCGSSVGEWEKNRMWEKRDEECVEAVWEKSCGRRDAQHNRGAWNLIVSVLLGCVLGVQAFCEMDFTIRFDKKKLKRNVCSVSTFCETDFTIRFSKKNKTKRRRAKDGACGVARKKGKRRKGVCGSSVGEWEKNRMWEKRDEECVEAVWEKSCGRRDAQHNRGAWNLIVSVLLGCVLGVQDKSKQTLIEQLCMYPD